MRKGSSGQDLNEGKSVLSKLEKYKYPLIMLVFGLGLLMLPGNSVKDDSLTGDTLLQQVLTCSSGVGKAQVISSENGVVIVCQGAENAQVRLDIIRAVGSYTGFGSDKITILKMAE